jgi:hypothetical protein
MERKGVKIFIIRLGKYNRGSLKNYTYKNRNVFYVRSFEELVRNAGTLGRAICAQQQQETDIYKFAAFKRANLEKPVVVAPTTETKKPAKQ